MFFLLSVFPAGAEEFWRLRYFVPSSEEGRITQGSGNFSEKPKTSGHSGHLVFANGFGVGYNTMATSGTLDGNPHSFKNDNLDLSYTVGERVSLTLGIGKQINGRGDTTLNGVSYVTESLAGEASFMSFGIPLLGGEFLLGYRQNRIEYKNYQGQVNGKTVTLADSVVLRSEQVNIGFGFLF